MAEFDIFNLSVSDVETHETKSANSTNEIYKPSADDGKDGTYKALIRFVPNPTNPRNSLVKKYVHWLTDANGDGRLIDSPSTVGDKCPIADAFFKLRKSDSAVDRKMSDKLKRREQYYSLIKVVKDPQNPELEGTYKVFKFGYKIKEKIEEETKPAFGEPTQIYDLFEGKNFELIITRQGEYNNYDKSKFSATRSAIGAGTDWQNQIYRTAMITDHNLSVSGGMGKSRVYGSLNYFEQEGIVKNTGIKKYIGRINLDTEISEKISDMFDLSPAAIEKRLKLRNPIYLETAAYGHMGRKNKIVNKTFEQPNGNKISLDVELFTWEKLDLVEKIKAEFNLN